MTLHHFVTSLEALGFDSETIFSMVSDCVQSSKEIFEDNLHEGGAIYGTVDELVESGFEIYLKLVGTMAERNKKTLDKSAQITAERIHNFDVSESDGIEEPRTAEEILEEMGTLEGCHSLLSYLIDQIENLKKYI